MLHSRKYAYGTSYCKMIYKETENKQRLMSDRSAVDSWILKVALQGTEYVTLAAVQEGYSDPSWSP